MDRLRFVVRVVRVVVSVCALALTLRASSEFPMLPPAGDGLIDILQDGASWSAPGGGSGFGNLSVSDNGTVNGIPIRVIPAGDPAFQYLSGLAGFTFSAYTWVFQNGEFTFDLSGMFVAISDNCEEQVGYVHPGNQKAWVACLATISHELNHLQHDLWMLHVFKSKAEENGSNDSEKLSLFLGYEAAQKEWDECMREGGAADDPDGDGDGVFKPNPATEAWTYERTGKCLCQMACALPDSPLRNKLIDQANQSFADAQDAWDEAEALHDEFEQSGGEEGCPDPPCGYPPLGDPAATSDDFGDVGPASASCDCSVMDETDYCSDLPTAL